MMAQPWVLQVQNLKKTFGKIEAVKDISFEIKAGSCFGLLGPNGAGKTTTLEMIEGIRSADSGQVLFYGQAWENKFSERIGIQTQSTEIFDKLKVSEALKVFQKLYQKPAALSELIETCFLHDILDRFVNKLSGGQKQRVYLALALVNNPDLLFLDEPTTGLDPQARRYVWDIVKSVKAKGKAILLTTHYLEEASLLCDEVAIMDHGKIIARGVPQDLLKTFFSGVILSIPKTAIPADVALPEGAMVENQRLLWTSQNSRQALEWLLKVNADVSDLQIRTKSLEDLFIEMTGKSLRG